ncbi:MAG: hypothetical protein HUK22_07970, partial [Thermoguttaceae bacterium]|nr:hypothetical protein [Thermoguttaceae bacterium]
MIDDFRRNFVFLVVVRPNVFGQRGIDLDFELTVGADFFDALRDDLGRAGIAVDPRGDLDATTPIAPAGVPIAIFPEPPIPAAVEPIPGARGEPIIDVSRARKGVFDITLTSYPIWENRKHIRKENTKK